MCHSFAIICGICAITWIDVGSERDVTLPPPPRKGDGSLWSPGEGYGMVTGPLPLMTRWNASGALAIEHLPAAMNDGATLNVSLAPQEGDASLVLQGAGLAYAVVCGPAK